MAPPLDGTVMITGASSGIGRELARLVAREAKALVLVARRRDRLEELKTELLAAKKDLVVHLEVRDLADPAAVEPLVAAAREAVGEIDVLVNNAGVGDMAMFDLSDATRVRKMIDLNVTSLVALTGALVPGMVARGRGGVLNISSGFGLSFLPSFAVYVGTKHFVTGFTEALRCDLAGTGVTVTQICPGPVATEFEQNIGNFTGQKVPGLLEISAERCARASLRAFRAGRAISIPGAVFWILMRLFVIPSPRFMHRIVGNVVARVLRRRQQQALIPVPGRAHARSPPTGGAGGAPLSSEPPPPP